MTTTPSTVATKKSAKPSVLAYSRSLNPGHVLMFSTKAGAGSGLTPIAVREEPLRGLNATTKSLKDGKMAEAVLQIVESAELAAGDDTLVLHGKIAINRSLLDAHACNERGYAELHRAVVDQAASSGKLEELARRYALNLASGNWAWRNALEADAVTVTVRWKEAGESKSVTFVDLLIAAENAFDLNQPQYAVHKAGIEALGAAMAKAMTSTSGYCTILSVEARLHMGIGARVYPSQEWASETMKKESVARWGEKSSGVTRVLAKLAGNQAIINDRKAGNALRMVDTWYGEGQEGHPIAVEPYGANSHQGFALRTGKAPSTFDLVAKICDGQALTDDEAFFYLASCIRGGVFGSKE